MIYFLDFDRTLFDTDGFVDHMSQRPDTGRLLERPGVDPTSILEELCARGELVFEPDELKQFVYADVPEFLRMAGNEAIVLTYGNPELQKRKIENALAGIPRISVLYTGDARKGDFMRERIGGYGAAALLADDRTVELESMAKHCPQVRLFQMRRDGTPGDGRWPVIRSLTELP